jgi:hypothetical protein
VIADIARDGGGEWKKCSGYHRRSLVEHTMYRLKAPTVNHLRSRHVGSQATEMAIRVGIVNRMAALARTQSIRIAGTLEAESSCSIYATTRIAFAKTNLISRCSA